MTDAVSTAVHVEVFVSPNPSAAVTQLGIEVFALPGNVAATATVCAVEVWATTANATTPLAPSVLLIGM